MGADTEVILKAGRRKDAAHAKAVNLDIP